MRKPTPEELETGWRQFAYRVNFARTISMDNAAVVQALKDLDAFVYAHGDNNGERSATAVQQNINTAFWQCIARREPPPAKKRGRPPKEKANDSTQ